MPDDVVNAINTINEFAKRAKLTHQEHMQHIASVERFNQWLQSTRAIKESPPQEAIAESAATN